MGAGLAILAATRPFEGCFFVLPFLAVLAWEYRRQAGALWKIAAPATALVGITLLGLGVYFTHVTGSPFVTTYQISQKTYGWPLGLAWTTPPHIEYRHVELARYYEYELSEHGKVDGPIDFVEYLTFRLQEYWRFFVGPVLSIPLVMLGQVWRRRRMLIAGTLGGISAILLEGAASPHYLAPATVTIVAIVVECCRYLNASKIRILPLLPATMGLVLALRIGAAHFGLPYTQKLNFQSWCCVVQGDLNKQRIATELGQLPGQQLVFVKAKGDPNKLFQWIYNDAAIDDARIVWAQDLGPERNAHLAAYFAGRRVWLVDPNSEPATCVPYRPAEFTEASSR